MLLLVKHPTNTRDDGQQEKISDSILNNILIFNVLYTVFEQASITGKKKLRQNSLEFNLSVNILITDPSVLMSLNHPFQSLIQFQFLGAELFRLSHESVISAKLFGRLMF